MTKRSFINLMILVLIYPLNELHTEFSHSNVQFINHWLKEGFDYALPTQYYAKYLCSDIADILKAVLLLRLSRMNQVLRIATGVYLSMCVFDLCLFFYDCNTTSYPMLYSMIGFITIIIAYSRRVSYKRSLYEQ